MKLKASRTALSAVRPNVWTQANNAHAGILERDGGEHHSGMALRLTIRWPRVKPRSDANPQLRTPGPRAQTQWRVPAWPWRMGNRRFSISFGSRGACGPRRVRLYRLCGHPARDSTSHITIHVTPHAAQPQAQRSTIKPPRHPTIYFRSLQSSVYPMPGVHGASRTRYTGHGPMAHANFNLAR